MKILYFYLLVLIQLFAVDSAIGQCTSAPYGAYGSLNPTCNGTYQNATTCGFRGEYSTITVTQGNNYSFQSSITSDYITIATTANAPLVWGTGTVTWTATFSGQVRFFTHTNSACGAGTGCRTRSVMCTAGGPPPNPCAAAINVPSLPVNNQSVVCSSSNNLNSSNVPACGGASTNYMGGNEALYTITPTTSGTYTISYNGQTWSSIWVWANACPASGGTCVGSVSSSASAQTLNVNLTAGVTYYVMFDTWPSPVSPCPGTFSITAPVPPYNPCSSIPNLTCGNQSGNVAASGSGAWNNYGGPFGVPGQEKLFTFTPTTTGAHQLEVLGISGGWVDFFYKTTSSGCNNSGWIYIDDVIGTGLVFPTVNLTAGVEYYFMWDPEGTGSYSVNFRVNCPTPPPPPPANDNCANAQSITIQCPAAATAVSGTTANATEEAMADPSCDPGTIRDVWYTFNSGPNTSVDLTLTLGTASWIGGEVHTTCGNPAPGLTIGGNAGNCYFNLSLPSPTVISGLVPNTTYRLRLFTNVDFDVAGSFTFTLTNSQNNPGAVSIPASICVGTPTSISNVTAATGGPNNVNYYFYYRGGPSNLGWQMYDGPTTNTSSSLPTTVINTPGTWFIARNSDFGCGQANNATTLDLQIIVSEVSTAPALSGTSPVCPATSVVLNATGGAASPGSTINWYTGPNGTGSLVGSGSSYTVTPSATSTYYARREGGYNTTADGTYTITVNNPTLTAAPTTGDMVWRGASSTDWATLPNWWQYNGTAYVSATAAPTITQNVIIPANQACVLNQTNTNANSGAAKTIRIENGATLSMTNGSLTVAENWVNNGTFTPGSGTVTFTGSGTHTISGSSGAHNFHNLTMNKTGEIQLSVPIAMTGALSLNNGRLTIGNFNLDLPANTINGGNANSFVHTSGTGVLMRNVGATAVNFPVGRGAYNPASLANSGTLDKYNVRVIDNVTDDGTAVGATTTMAVVNRTWMINEQVAGGSNVNLTLQWNGPAEQVNNFVESSAFIAHYMAADGLWDNIGGTVQSPGVIQAGGITSFSPFTVSSDNSFAPLPVKLTSFQANCTEKGYNSVTWQTESETNSSHFIVERSRDGAVWSTVSSLPAAGTSVELKNYAISDISAGANFEGYYRLRQVDFDGEQEVFGPISINCDHVEHDYVEVYPNPSNGNFKARVYSNSASANVLIKVCAANGKVVHQQMTNLDKGVTTLFFEQNQLEKGMYFIQIMGENIKLAPQKLIIH